MAYALEIFFDAQTDAAIRRLWDQLERAGVPTLLTASHQRHDPHVTLAVGEERPKVGDDLVSALKPLPGRTLDFLVRELHPYAGFGATIAAVGLVDIATGDVEHLVGS